jgi:hypothetical protein
MNNKIKIKKRKRKHKKYYENSVNIEKQSYR